MEKVYPSASMVPDRRYGSVHHGSLEVSDRVIDVSRVGVKSSESVLDDFFGQPPVKRDCCGEVHQAPGVFPEDDVCVGHAFAFGPLLGTRWLDE